MTAESAGADKLLGRVIAGKFRVERALGQGAMGKVYLAEQTNLGKMVALKVLHANMAGDPALEKRFHREARSASMLSHPNIVQTVDFGNDDGVLFIAMELLSGRDLRAVIKEEWPFAPERVAHIVGQILSALDEAHAKGVVHRDLKPENVMITDVRGEPDFVKVCDFGIAKVQSERDGEGSAITSAGMVCGTPEYMSPEQARGDPLDGRSDLYAAAVILYHMVAGELPFRAESALGVVTKHLVETPVPPSKKRAGVTVAPLLESLILRGMEKERDKRHPTASEMKGALYEAVGLPRPRSSTSSPARPAATTPSLAMAATGVATPAPRAQSPSGSLVGELTAAKTPAGRAVWAVGALVAGMALAGLGYLVFGRERPQAARPDSELVFAANDPLAAHPKTAAPPATAPVPSVFRTAPVAAPPAPPVAAPPVFKPLVAAPPPADSHHRDKLPHHREHSAAPSAVHPASTAPVAAPPAVAAPPPAHGFAAVYGEADALFKVGDINGALAKYGEAARLNPSDARTQRQLGRCYTRLGERDRAAPHYRKYLELAPDASDAQFIKADLDGK